MSSYSEMLRVGSSGQFVKDLQTSLNKLGYGLEVDGVFGSKTYDAVLDYQTKNDLRIKDGVVGNETWGSLANTAPAADPAPKTSAAVLSGVSQETADALARLEQGAGASAETDAAGAEVNSVEARKPADYISGYSQELQKLYEQMAGRKAFSYDPGKDALFQDYAREYARRGRQAMADTVGKSAALSGGYASSYAQTAGQQTYQSYLQQLYDLVPQLEENARQQYDQEGKALSDRYSLLQKQEEQSYDQWRDKVSDWQSQRDLVYKAYESARSQDDSRYKLLLNYYADKAAAEEKAAPEGAVNNSGAAASADAAGPALSSVAYGSLNRAVGNYLKGGSYENARALFEQYQSRMTAQQKASLSALFGRYGAAV